MTNPARAGVRNSKSRLVARSKSHIANPRPAEDIQLDDPYSAQEPLPCPDMETDWIALRTWLRLLTCSNVIEGRVRGLLRDEFDTTLPRFDLLAQLDAAAKESIRGLTMSELSRRLMVTNGNLTGLVDRLAREHLVSRVVSSKDRRTQMVRMTAAGKRALDTMTPDHLDWIRTMFAGLSPDECQQLYHLLGKLKRSAQNASIQGSTT